MTQRDVVVWRMLISHKKIVFRSLFWILKMCYHCCHADFVDWNCWHWHGANFIIWNKKEKKKRKSFIKILVKWLRHRLNWICIAWLTLCVILLFKKKTPREREKKKSNKTKFHINWWWCANKFDGGFFIHTHTVLESYQTNFRSGWPENRFSFFLFFFIKSAETEKMRSLKYFLWKRSLWQKQTIFALRFAWLWFQLFIFFYF